MTAAAAAVVAADVVVVVVVVAAVTVAASRPSFSPHSDPTNGQRLSLSGATIALECLNVSIQVTDE